MEGQRPAAMRSDHYALEDHLDFAPYADTIASIVSDESTDTPLTIGVFGEWGSGKTTLLKMVEERVRDNHVAVWFTAWKYDKEEVLWRV